MTDRWQDGLESQELRESPVLDTFKTQEDAFQGLVELKAYQGRSMKLPGDEPTVEEKAAVIAKFKDKIPGIHIMPDSENPEDVKRYWNELGVPEDADGYVPPADFEVLDEDLMTQLKDIAHKAGLTTKQYHAMLGEFSEGTKNLAEQNVTLKEEQAAKLKQTWGSAHDDNTAIVDAMVKQFQDKDVPLGELNNAAKIFMVNVAKSLSSDPQIFKQINEPKSKFTPAELRGESEDIRVKLLDSSVKGERRKGLLKRSEAIYKELERFAPQ